MKLYKTILFFLPFVFVSCEQEKTIDYDVDYTGTSRIIIQGFINNKNGVEVLVSKSVPPNDIYASNYLDSATVRLYENGTYLFGLTETDSGLFKSPPNFKAVYNQEYQIKAKAPGWEEAVSTPVTIRPPVGLDTVYLEKPDDLDNKDHLKVFYAFSDPPDESNLYYLKYYYNVTAPIVDTRKIRIQFNNMFDERFYYTRVVIDSLFSGKQKLFYLDALKLINIDSIKLELHNLSPSIYRYLKSIIEYDYAYSDPFNTKPPIVYSNIENGAGLFGAYSVDTVWVKVDKSLFGEK